MTTGSQQFPWFALQVRTRHEPGIAGFLRAKEYEIFLPVYSCRKRWSDRVKTVENPLFPGYVFCRFDSQERLPILKTPGVIQVVGYNRIPVPVDDSEIHAIQTLMRSGLPNQPWPFLSIGDPVRIEAGPLQGCEGPVVQFKGKYRLILCITLLHQSVAVEIDSVCVKSLRSSSVARLDKAKVRVRPLDLAI
jgi:transcription antitermination factor NusG